MGSEPAPTRRRFLQIATALAVGVPTGLASHDVIFERERLEVTRADLRPANWPRAFDGLTVALLTDLHRSEWVSREYLERVVDTTLALEADLVLLGGDYVTWGNRGYLGSVADTLARLRARHGVYAVLGNHDDDRDSAAALDRGGIEVLRDQRTRLRLPGGPLDLVGIRFWTRRASDIAEVTDLRQPARILVAHDPRRLPEAAELGFPVVLAGHTHGGQVVIPGLGAPAARKFPIAAGTLRQGDTTLFVSRGIGTVYVPVRYGCPPEVALLTLRASDGPRG